MNEWTVAIGVDTHKQQHVAVALDRLGRQIDALTVEATTAAYRQLLVWARGRGEPVFGIEGCGSYGAGLARFLAQRGAVVYECERPHRGERRGGKNDLVDATLAARRVVSGVGLSLPRGDGSREQLRRILLERRGAVRARTAALNQLDALIVTGPDDLRGHLTGVGKRRLVGTVARLRPRSGGATHVLRRVARRIQALDAEIREIDHELGALVSGLAPDLLGECGVGAVCAAQLLVSSGDPRRMASEASFAALAGTSPIDASSGKQQRHRLNRGGDRQLNWALHVIALQRVRHHDQTRAYYQRLLANGKTTKEARRCIKRALARHFYHRLRETPTTRLDNIEASVRGIRSGGGWDSNPRVTLTAIAGFQDQTALAQQSHPGKVSVPFLALPAGVSCGTMDAAAMNTHPATRPIYRESDGATGGLTSRGGTPA